MKLILAAAALVLVLFTPDCVLACTCGTPTACASFEAAEAVLIGTVMRVEDRTAKDSHGVDYIVGQTAYVQVDEAFKGVKSQEMIFRGNGSSCDRHYGAGQRWLFYAYHNKEENTWFSAACDRSAELAWAADDLLFLRGLPGSAQKTRIAGTLRNRDYAPLAGVKVKLVSGFWTQEVVTDKNGVYEALGLPTGTYTIEPETPPNLKLRYTSRSLSAHEPAQRAEKVELKAKSCVVMNFHYAEDTLVRGRVFGAGGEPMRDVCVHLVFKDKPDDTPYLGDCTDENGRFNIDGVLLGEYFLVANEDGAISSDEPFPTAYYPGVFEREKATTLTFGRGDKLQDFDIHVPSQRASHVIEGRLLFEDGRPAMGVSVKFEAESKVDQVDAEANAIADSDGRFRLRVLEGIKGTVYGYMRAYSGEFLNCPKLEKIIKAREGIFTNSVSVEVNRDLQDLELVFPFPKCKRPKE